MLYYEYMREMTLAKNFILITRENAASLSRIVEIVDRVRG